MNRYEFKIDGLTYKRITKTTAKKLFNAGCDIAILPCKANPLSNWISFYTVNKNRFINDWNFEDMVNNYEYYNCNNDLGKYTAFYSIY